MNQSGWNTYYGFSLSGFKSCIFPQGIILYSSMLRMLLNLTHRFKKKISTWLLCLFFVYMIHPLIQKVAVTHPKVACQPPKRTCVWVCLCAFVKCFRGRWAFFTMPLNTCVSMFMFRDHVNIGKYWPLAITAILILVIGIGQRFHVDPQFD